MWHEDNVFGHTRLSIIDLSSNGNQPMISKSKRYVITFNGEIYNYIDIKSKLDNEKNQLGRKFDTEVLLEAIEFWGIDKALYFSRGMFALAIWDRKKNNYFS